VFECVMANDQRLCAHGGRKQLLEVDLWCWVPGGRQQLLEVDLLRKTNKNDRVGFLAVGSA
jgi:hypothetical protein